MKKMDFNGQKNICGENVRLIRLKQKLSQTNLAAKMQVMGVSIEQDAISRIESGERLVTDYEVKALAEALGVGYDLLLNSGNNQRR